MLDHWREIYSSIRHHKLRTGLTALSIGWGITMLTALLGLGVGLENSARWEFRDDAINSLWLWAGKTARPHAGTPPGRQLHFRNDDYDTLKAVDGVEHITSRYRVNTASTSYGNRSSSFQIRATHPAHRFLENTIVREGRFLNQRDIDTRTKVAVIGEKVEQFLFRGKRALGEYINIGNVSHRVVGIFSDIGGDREAQIIYVPISTAQTAYGGADHVDQIMFTVGNATAAETKKLEADIRNVLARKHVFAPQDPQAIRIRNNLESYRETLEIFELLRILIWVMGIGTLIAGVIGISNIMLISVKERTREIGMRKAIGASPLSVLGLIVSESVLVTAIAGYLGLVLGFVLVDVIGSLEFFRAFVREPAAKLSIVSSATVILIIAGTTAGLFPALRAAKIKPVEALREA